MHALDRIRWTPELADDILRRWLNGETWDQLSREYRRDASQFRKSVLSHSTFQADPEIIRQNVQLAKRAQGQTDLNRIERKAFREHARVENAVAVLDRALIDLLKEHRIAVPVPKERAGKSTEGEPEGIVQISDSHFNELIDLPCNKFDFAIASRRMRQFARQTVRIFDAFGIKRALVAMTGDIINSDRRIDELLSQSTNRASAVFLAVRILHQFIADLAGHYRLRIAGVTGNESRLGENIAWSKVAASDNYDLTVFNILDCLFAGSKGVEFVRSDDPNEQVIEVGGRNILLLHGTKIGKDAEQEVAKLVGRYARRGTVVHCVLFGHLHTAFISDLFGRSGSLPGANAYSEEGLNLSSRASQNIYIVDGGIHAMKIDLQEASGQGYDIEEALAKYAPKAPELLHQPKTIMKVVV